MISELTTLGTAEALCGELAGLGMEPTLLGAAAPPQPGLRAALFVTAGGGLQCLYGALQHWRAAQLPLLLAGLALRAEELRAALEHGVHDFMCLPCSAGELGARLQRVLVPAAPVAAASARPDPRLRDMVGTHPAFLRQVHKLPVFASCDAGVLILGETGTGKEVCAQAIHYLSARRSGPWVAVNCGALPEGLVENELFGHVKGAYTTAHASCGGLVREAEGGSLFLDDVDCLALPAQVKLLRFLQEHEYRPVGASGVRHADVRVIAASNLCLPQLVARGVFRQDLYFRLNVLALELPPLRERPGDIAALARHFVQRFARQYGRGVTGLTPQALARLQAHAWPGNVRELQHTLERAVLLAPGPELGACDIELPGMGEGGAGPGEEPFNLAKRRVVREFERSYIEQLLARCAGNVTRAAQHAGKDRRAFFELMRKHAITPARFRAEADTGAG
ncbi:sigma-54 interaction domain-containing protein [Azohydromonas caseinilytica]|uniref:Sigma-54-dependent Fis family transcriptional regulator n=1 Tax=Azohydromonas caseinilytica TaxID=2728836 RepID=A0A848FBX7_9BURK|nr:sigma-54 dependent transcriptional regulator [Azohydromonas caseinilytica]NML16818.1 sigma-54-dependent Fis family transcriptional regulator [Azohydromonas caseinilytica]